MILYFGLILFLTILFFLVSQITKDKKKRKVLLFIFSFLPLILLWIFKKDTLGSDISNYIIFYKQTNDKTWTEIISGTDPLFFLQMKIFSSVGASYYVFQCFYYLKVAFFFGFFLWKKTERPDLCILAFVFYLTFGFSFTVYREFEAFCILLFASLFLEKGGAKNRLVFLFFLLVAVGYHKVALTGIIFFIFSFLRNKNWSFLTYLIVLIAFFILSPGISAFLGLLDFDVLPYKPSNIGFGKSWFETLFYFGLFLVSFLLYYPNHNKLNKFFKSRLLSTDCQDHFSEWTINPITCLFFVTLANLMGHYFPVFYRFSYLFFYYSLPAIFDVNNKSSLLSKPVKISLIIFLYVTGFACFLYFIYRKDVFSINPYEFFWN